MGIAALNQAALSAIRNRTPEICLKAILNMVYGA